MTEKLFIFHQILQDVADFCDMDEVRERLKKGVTAGGRFVLYGRRDVGKTSLLKTLVIPHFKEFHKKNSESHFVIFCDLMGVINREQISMRLRAAFERAFSSSFPSKSRFAAIMQGIKTLRPTMSIDENGVPQLRVESKTKEKVDFTDVLSAIHSIADRYPTLVVLDEFQDIHGIEEMEALFRDAFQNMPIKSSIVVSGSKKHLLSKIFTPAGSPFCGWGEPVNIEPIPFEDYQKYINDRLQKVGLILDLEVATRLQNYLFRVPEAINIICQRLIDVHINTVIMDEPHVSLSQIQWPEIESAVNDYLDAAGSSFEEFMRQFSPNEERLLIAIAKCEYVQSPFSADFLSFASIPAGTMQKILPKLENEAIIYRETSGYSLANPLLAIYLKNYR